MARPRTDDRSGLLGEPPDDVRVTVVLPAGGGLRLRQRAARFAPPPRTRTVGVLAALILALVAGIALSGRGAPGRPEHAVGTRGCTAAVVSLDPPNASNAGLEHAVWCVRYAGHGAALSYRFIGGALPAFGSPSRG